MHTSLLMFNKRYFSFGTAIYIIATYFGLKFNINLGKDNANVFAYSLYFATVLTIISATLYLVFHKKPSISASIISVWLTVIIFIVGFSRVCYVQSLHLRNNKLLSANPKVYAVVTDEPKLSSSGKSYSVTSEVFQVGEDTDAVRLNKPIRTITFFERDSVATPVVGEVFKCTYTTELDMNPAFKGAFDYSRYIKQNNISGSYYTRDYRKLDSSHYSPTPFRKLCNFSYSIRNAITKSFYSLSYGPDETALLEGILLGKVSNFSDDLYTNYTDSGLIHIASVSGMHTSYIFLVISIILTIMHIPRRSFALFTIPALILFAAIALFTPSVNRSVIMLSVMLLAAVFKRENDSITALAISALLIVINNPYSLESYSFLLSFSATLGLLIYANTINSKLNSVIHINSTTTLGKLSSNLTSYIVNSISLSLSGMIGISFFTAHFFGRISFGGILGNIIIFPAVAVIFVGGFLTSLIFYICHPLSELIAFYIMSPALKLTNYTAELFSKNIFSLNIPHPSIVSLPIYIVICYTLYILLTSHEKGPLT